MSENEEYIATLVSSDKYKKHINQASMLTDKKITFIKRKLISKEGIELETYKMSDCIGFSYKVELAIGKLILGVSLVSLIIFIFVCIYLYWDEIESGTPIYIGLFLLALWYGVNWITGSKRHKMVFNLENNKKLLWRSRSGEFKTKKISVNRVLEFMNNKIPQNDFKNYL